MNLTEHKCLLHQINPKNQNSIKDMGDLFPGMVQINRKSDLKLLYMNEEGQKLTGISPVALENKWDSNVIKHGHPGNLELIWSHIRKFGERDDSEEILTYFQYLRKEPGEEYRWFLSMKKIFNEKYNYTLAIPLSRMDHLANALKPYAEANFLITKNYQYFESLSKREKEVLKMVCNGLSTKEISDKLFISTHTFITHRKIIKNKLHTKSHIEMVKLGELFFK